MTCDARLLQNNDIWCNEMKTTKLQNEIDQKKRNS